MSSFFSLLIVFVTTLTVVFAQSTVVKPGYVFDPTGTPVNTNYYVSNIINGDWNSSPGWNPTVPNLNVFNYFYAQFSWSSGSTGGFNTSKLLVTGFTVSMSGDGTHQPTSVGVIPKGGANIYEAVQTWAVPKTSQPRFNMTFTFPTPQPLSNFTVFFYNGAEKFQVYIYQIEFLTHKAVTPVAVIDPYNTPPSVPGYVVENIIQTNPTYWNPSFPSGPAMYHWFYTVFTLPSLGTGLVHNITGFEIWTTLDATHTFSETGLSIGYQNSRDHVLQTFSFPNSSTGADTSGQPNGWPQGWASFRLSSPVGGNQFSLYYYNNNSMSQVYLLGVRFYTSSSPTCDVGYFNSGSASSPVCTMCPAGTFSAQAGSTTCTLCPAGTYQNVTGSTSCSACPAGTFNSNTGSTTAGSCNFCQAGYISSAGSYACSACPAGSFTPSQGSSNCILCPPGQYSSSSASGVCSVCPDNMISVAGSTSSSACAACPAGTTGGGKVPICCPNGPSDDGLALSNLTGDLMRLAAAISCFTPSPVNPVCSVSAAVSIAFLIKKTVDDAKAITPSPAVYCKP